MLCRKFGYVDLSVDSPTRPLKVIICIKGVPDGLPRSERLIVDPLDNFSHEPVEVHWEEHVKRTEFKVSRPCEWLATNPLVAAEIRKWTTGTVHLAPHWPDPEVIETEPDFSQPWVYHGEPKFLRVESRLRAELGFVLGTGIENASFPAWRRPAGVISVRVPCQPKELNESCKPQVKLANALAAGLPCLCSDIPAVRSLLPVSPFMEAIETSAALNSAAAINGVGGLLWILPRERTFNLPSHLCR